MTIVKRIKGIIEFFRNLKKTKLIRKLIKVVTSTSPAFKAAWADKVLTTEEKKMILKNLIINIIIVLFEKEDKSTKGIEEAIDEL